MFDDYRLSELRRLHDAALIDTCQRLVHGTAAGGYSYGQAAYTEGETLPCLVTQLSQDEVMGSAQIRMGDVRIRFERTATLAHKDRVKVTKLHGDVLSVAQTYEIIAGPQIDHTGQEVLGRLVTDGSEI